MTLLANLFKRTAVQEMIHVETLAERILFLKGDVVMEVGGEVEPIRDVKKMLEKAAKMEETSALEYNQWAIEVGPDSATRKIFEQLVVDEERHFDQYDTELDNMGKFGENYLALQSIERSKNRSAGGGE